MFKIKMADFVIEIENRGKYVEALCRDYICATETPTDILIPAATNDEIKEEMEATDPPAVPAYAESICVYRKICKELLSYKLFLLHSSVVECDGKSYAFAAPSGTGKSTHTGLWLKHFGDRARIINGDKPIYKVTDDGVKVYGTPWCGKEGLHTNTSSPLAALCFIERGQKNEIRKIDESEAVMRIFTQILVPDNESDADLFFPIIDEFIRKVPCYALKCNISDEAVEVAYGAMKG